MNADAPQLLTDLTSLTALPETPIRAILERINGLSQHFQLVVGRDGRLLGTITDGDIRRALLRAFDIDAPASSCMNATPIVGRLSNMKEAYQRLYTVPLATPFLPIVADDGVLNGVLSINRRPPSIAAALVMAGGEGRRLGELTRNVPKPLLPVQGRPMLDILLERLEDSGVPEIFISVRYLAEQIRDFVAARKNNAKISLLQEDEPLGTGGAIGLLPDEFKDHLLVVNGDVVTDVNYRELKAFNDRHGFDGCLAVTRYQINVPFGVVDQNHDGSFAGIREKPDYTHLISAGIYYLSPALRALAPRNGPFDMPEILTLGSRAGLKIGLFPVHESWRDIGRPADFQAAQDGKRAGS